MPAIPHSTWTGQEQQQQQTAGPALMLARIAHELYWIGRYVARADDTARMLDGLFRASLQSPGGPTARACPGRR